MFREANNIKHKNITTIKTTKTIKTQKFKIKRDGMPKKIVVPYDDIPIGSPFPGFLISDVTTTTN